jgi:hypothetical protein
MIATTGDPMRGGVMLCQVKDCTCYATWSPQGVDREKVREPDEAELAGMRQALQSEPVDADVVTITFPDFDPSTMKAGLGQPTLQRPGEEPHRGDT